MLSRWEAFGCVKENYMNATEPEPAIPEPKCRWYRCNVRLASAFVIFCVIVASWFACRTIVAQIERQRREAREAVYCLGGGVMYSR
jgi:hypothetical protein